MLSAASWVLTLEDTPPLAAVACPKMPELSQALGAGEGVWVASPDRPSGEG